MSKLLKMFGMAAMLGVLMMVGGCGGDDNETPVVTNPSVTSPFAATINPDGTATTGANTTIVAAPPGTTGYLAGVSVTLPPNTVITAKNADGTPKVLNAPISFTFTAPADSSATVSGTNGIPVPTGFVAVNSAAGAIDVQITGAASATFDHPITITIPVPGQIVGTSLPVYSVTGTTYTLIGNFPVTASSTGSSVISFPVSSLSWKVVNPFFRNATGGTGGVPGI